MATPKRIEVKFYKSNSGSEPVREWLLSLSKEDRGIIGDDIRTVEFGWPVGMPTCRHLTDGVWEVRSSLPHGRIARVLFCISGQTMHLLHGFFKKSQQTRINDLELALQRQKNLKRYDDAKSP